MANLTREEMLAEQALGRSILFNPTTTHPGGRQAITADHLPSEAELAKASGDPIKKAAAREALLAQRQAIDAVLTGLDVAEPIEAPRPIVEEAKPIKVDPPKAPGKAS